VGEKLSPTKPLIRQTDLMRNDLRCGSSGKAAGDRGVD